MSSIFSLLDHFYNICAPSMHVHASEWKRASPLTGPTMIACDTCSAFFFGLRIYWVSPLAILFSFESVSSFRIKNID